MPSEVTSAQAFGISSVILLLMSAILSMQSLVRRRAGLRCVRFIVDVAAFVTVVGFVASISLSSWVKDLQTENSGVIPLVTSDGELIPFSARMRYGSAFFTYSFIIIMLILMNITRVVLYLKSDDSAVMDAGVRFPEDDKYSGDDIIRASRTLATV